MVLPQLRHHDPEPLQLSLLFLSELLPLLLLLKDTLQESAQALPEDTHHSALIRAVAQLSNCLEQLLNQIKSQVMSVLFYRNFLKIISVMSWYQVSRITSHLICLRKMCFPKLWPVNVETVSFHHWVWHVPVLFYFIFIIKVGFFAQTPSIFKFSIYQSISLITKEVDDIFTDIIKPFISC